MVIIQMLMMMMPLKSKLNIPEEKENIIYKKTKKNTFYAFVVVPNSFS